MVAGLTRARTSCVVRARFSDSPSSPPHPWTRSALAVWLDSDRLRLETNSTSRPAVVTRRIGSGELIHTAEAVVSHPSLHAVCYSCPRKPNSGGSPAQAVLLCSDGCRVRSQVFYEVETRADWSLHDGYCRAQGLKYPLLVKRLACMVISGATSSDCLDILQPAYLSPEMIAEQWYTTLLARSRINEFHEEVGGGLFEDLLSMAAASVEAEAAAGNAVYMPPSFYNDDSDPNTHIV